MNNLVKKLGVLCGFVFSQYYLHRITQPTFGGIPILVLSSIERIN
jgi:hypothetical protein